MRQISQNSSWHLTNVPSIILTAEGISLREDTRVGMFGGRFVGY